MQNDDTTTAPLDIGLTDVKTMLARRGRNMSGEDELFPVETTTPKVRVYWSFRRGNLGAVAVEDLNKDTAKAVMTAYKDSGLNHMIVIHNGGCTKDGLGEISAGSVEHWNATRLYLNPFKFNFFRNAELVDKPPDIDKGSRMIIDDPVAQYLGARVGDVVRIDADWGPLEPTTKYRLVVPA